MNLEEIEKLFSDLEPFDKLSAADTRVASENMDIEYFKVNEILSSPEKKPEYLYIIIKGIVQESDDADETIKLYHENDFFDPRSLIEKRSKNIFKVTEELIAYTLPRNIFLDIVYKNEEIENFFFKSIADKLNEKSNHDQAKDLANFMVSKVSEAYIKKPLIVEHTESILGAVRKMYQEKKQNLLVNKDGEYGIVTDTDFRYKVILNELPYNTPVDEITTYGLITIRSDDFLTNAQLLMTKNKVKRIIVKDDGEIIGILDQISLISFLSSHTYAVSNEIDNAKDINDLKEAGKKTIKVIKTLFEKGVKVAYISKLISEFNEKIFKRIFELTATEKIRENTALLVMGSEGRGEQIMKTDQDNALIVRDGVTIDKKELEDFSNNFTDILLELGYPRCSGNIMLSNPYWRKSSSEYRYEIRTWVDKPSEEGMMNFAIFYDAKCVAGNEKLLRNLKLEIKHLTTDRISFFANFARPSLSFETPIGFFTSFKVEKDHENQLDIKKGGIFAIVHGIRTIALQEDIKETNTTERISEIQNLGIIDKQFASELTEAFNYLSTLRLKSALEKYDNGGTSDNYIDPATLNKIDKDLLRDSFVIVNNFKKFLTYRYKLNMV